MGYQPSSHEKRYRDFIGFMIVMMLVGLFFSRTLLTVGMTLLFAGAILFTRPTSLFLNYFNNRYNLLLSALLLIPLVSGLWSHNMNAWWHECLVKVPLVAIPFAFYKPGVLDIKGRLIVNVLIVVAVTLGTFWSIAHYFINSVSMQNGYLQSTLLPVPLANDHVLFSWLVVIAIILIPCILKEVKPRQAFVITAYIVFVWLIIFLHILAARTGLIAFYAVGVFWIFSALRTRSFKFNISLSILLLTLPILCYFILPTFHNRVIYVLYDLQQYSRGSFPQGFSDVSRIASYQGGLTIIRQHPLLGVGFGDVNDTMQAFYRVNFPEFTAHDSILPHNEWLMYAAGGGLIAIAIFTACILYPFTLRKNHSLTAFQITALFCCMFDLPLELQNGVFIFCFFTCWFRTSPDG